MGSTCENPQCTQQKDCVGVFTKCKGKRPERDENGRELCNFGAESGERNKPLLNVKSATVLNPETGEPVHRLCDVTNTLPEDNMLIQFDPCGHFISLGVFSFALRETKKETADSLCCYTWFVGTGVHKDRGGLGATGSRWNEERKLPV